MFLHPVKLGALLAALSRVRLLCSLEYFCAQAQDLVMVRPLLLQFSLLFATDL